MMPLIYRFGLLGVGLFTLTLASLAWSADSSLLQAKGACTSGESWSFSPEIHGEWKSTYQDFLSKKMTPIQGFAEALALRRVAVHPTEKLFAEFWVSRALQEMGMTHLAYKGFEFLARSSGHAGLQQSAVACIGQILKQYSSMGVTPALASQVLKMPSTEETQELALRTLFERVGEKEASSKELQTYVKYLSGSGAYESLGRAVLAARERKHTEVSQNIRTAFSLPGFKRLETHEDPVRLLLARALYAAGDFDGATQEFLKINKSSNELSHALQELTWAYVRKQKYKEAIGTASNLQTGGLKNTFSPEGGLVMAISLNELCHYPESLQALNNLKKDYRPVYEWLENWSTQKEKMKLYPLALQYLKQGKEVPARVAGEWVRSPLFISRQEEINSFFAQKRSIETQQDVASVEIKKMALDLLGFLRDFKPVYLRARAKVPIGESLPEFVQKDLDVFKKKIAHYRRLQRAAGPFQKMTAFSVKEMLPREQKLLSEIDKDLKRINARMYAQLQSVAEDSHFLEVEIFQGASQDIVWKNAHPEFEEFAKKVDRDNEKKTKAFGHVYNWGKVGTILGENQEVWEDELGSYRADMEDQCNSRDTFLAEKRKAAARGIASSPDGGK